MKGFIADLPPEIRLDIYERLLVFDSPLKRIKTIENLDGTIEDELRQYVRGDRVDLSIIFACRTTYEEALPIFYNLNTMSLCHKDVCTFWRGFPITACDRELVTKMLVVDWLEIEPWTQCWGCTENVARFFSAFNVAYFPKLKSLTVDLERFRGGYSALGEQLLKNGIDVNFTFTSVGTIAVTALVATPKLEIRFK